MYNTSTFGMVAQVTASNTFPNGFKVSAWSDDADPLTSPDLEVANAGMGTNGDLVVWSKPEGIEITLSVIPTSVDDQNLDALLDANRVAKNKQSARDTVNVVLVYPNGITVNMGPGFIMAGNIVPQASTQGKMKTRDYKFKFEQVTKTGQTQAAA